MKYTFQIRKDPAGAKRCRVLYQSITRYVTREDAERVGSTTLLDAWHCYPMRWLHIIEVP